MFAPKMIQSSSKSRVLPKDIENLILEFKGHMNYGAVIAELTPICRTLQFLGECKGPLSDPFTFTTLAPREIKLVQDQTQWIKNHYKQPDAIMKTFKYNTMLHIILGYYFPMDSV